MKSKIFFMLAVLFVFGACEKDEAEEEKTEKQMVAEELLRLVNEVRKSGYKCGNKDMPAVDPLVLSDQLVEAAHNHSVDMDEKGYFSHTSQDGRKPGERISATDYNWSTYGENIAMGQRDAEQVMTSWLNSDGHC